MVSCNADDARWQSLKLSSEWLTCQSKWLNVYSSGPFCKMPVWTRTGPELKATMCLCTKLSLAQMTNSHQYIWKNLLSKWIGKKLKCSDCGVPQGQCYHIYIFTRWPFSSDITVGSSNAVIKSTSFTTVPGCDMIMLGTLTNLLQFTAPWLISNWQDKDNKNPEGYWAIQYAVRQNIVFGYPLNSVRQQLTLAFNILLAGVTIW